MALLETEVVPAKPARVCIKAIQLDLEAEIQRIKDYESMLLAAKRRAEEKQVALCLAMEGMTAAAQDELDEAQEMAESYLWDMAVGWGE